MIHIKFRDIDPDTGNVSQEKVIATCENPEVANEIEKKIKTKLGIGVPRAVADLPADELPPVVANAPEADAKAANA